MICRVTIIENKRYLFRSIYHVHKVSHITLSFLKHFCLIVYILSKIILSHYILFEKHVHIYLIIWYWAVFFIEVELSVGRCGS